MSVTIFAVAKLVVGNLDSALQFYSRIAGYSEEMRVTETVCGRPITESILKAPTDEGSRLMLIAYDDEPRAASGEVILTFQTDDMGEFLETLVAAGGSIADPPRVLEEFGLNVAFARDPEGHLLEIVQSVAAS